jgi:protein-S-isoprenylcysteine O-methyltransferase Ste14
MRTFALIRTLVIGTLFVSIWVWFVPRWFLGGAMHVVHAEAWLVGAAGAAIVAWCALEFALRGHGTPAPFDPPRQLVVSGLYHFVRNPMYLGLGVLLCGEAWLVGRVEILYEVLALWIAVSGFVLLYEEPVLREKFGAAYDDYRAHVPRWIPHLHPFDKAGSGA